MDDEKIYEITKDEETCLNYCIDNGLIKENKVCCGKRIFATKRMKNNIPHFIYRCNNTICRKQVSVRKDTFFERSNLSLGQILKLIYFFVKEETKIERLKIKTKIKSKTTIIDWLNFCRDICAEYLNINKPILGGVMETVEIDEAVLNKRKYNRGRNLKEQWVFGIYEVSSKKCVVVEIPDRKRETLFPIIFKHVLLGTRIFTDSAPVYNTLSSHDYFHYTCNHSIGEFVNPENGATTNHVEAMWQRCKNSSKIRFGTHRSTLGSHLNEFMWRSQFKNDFETFLEHLKLIYK